MSNADADKLRRLMLVAEEHVREHMVEQSYRRDACRAVRERILEQYHEGRWEAARAVADALAGVATLLVPPDDVDWKPAGRVPVVPPIDRARTQPLMGWLDEPATAEEAQQW